MSRLFDTVADAVEQARLRRVALAPAAPASNDTLATLSTARANVDTWAGDNDDELDQRIKRRRRSTRNHDDDDGDDKDDADDEVLVARKRAAPPSHQLARRRRRVSVDDEEIVVRQTISNNEDNVNVDCVDDDDGDDDVEDKVHTKHAIQRKRTRQQPMASTCNSID